MAGGIKIPFIADVSSFIKGTDNVSDALEDVSDSLNDVARDARTAGEDAGEGLARGIEDGARDAESGVERLERDLRDSLEKVEREAKDTGDGIEKLGDAAKDAAREGDNAFDKLARSTRKVDDATDAAGEGMGEFKDEANSTAREAAASFDGSADSIQDVFQELAANAFAGFGPAGAAAGLAAAVGLGLAVSALQSGADKANEAKERIVELARAIDEAGGDISNVRLGERIREWGQEIVDQKSWWELWQDTAVTALEDVQKRSRELGLDWKTIARGMGGDTEDYQRALEDINERIAEFDGRLEDVRSSTERGGHARAAAVEQVQRERQAYVDMRSDLEKANAETKAAIELQRLFEESTGLSVAAMEAYDDAAGEVAGSSDTMATAIEAAAERQAAATEDASDSAADYADTAVASFDDVIAAQERQLQAAVNFETNTQAVYERLGQDAVDWALAQGENADEAMQMLANAPLEKGQEIAANHRRLGELNSDSLVDGLRSRQAAAREAGRALSGAVAQGVRDQQGAGRSAGQALWSAVNNEISSRRITIPVGLSQEEFRVKVYTDVVENTYRRYVDMPV